ncbi:RUN domain-containing protein 1 isoform X2 [Hydra vulgaris]|uniref:RUN domain-containing protein 1 isoform X2 n=1 Tax=Hydra vulgaris TaxID=6087 RepID=UPI001F5FC15F|nr:RUN domain-containing protein 1 isoform X2 [Hydra vulgaris]
MINNSLYNLVHYIMSYQQFMFDEAFQFQDNHYNLKCKEQDEVIEVENQRVPPLGACSNESIDSSSYSSTGLDFGKLLELQEQSEQLNCSLYALTSHFAQVQFRLKQIIHAPKEDQEKLLSELETFAFEGCPDVVGPRKINCTSCESQNALQHYEQRIAEEKEREMKLNLHLMSMINNMQACKTKLEEDSKHKIKNNLSTKSTLPLENRMLPDVNKYIGDTIGLLVDPNKGKNEIISQVTKQISAMEKLVSFLQEYEEPPTTIPDSVPQHIQRNTAPAEKKSVHYQTLKHSEKIPAPHTKILQMTEEKRKRLHEASLAIIKKSLALLQIFAISQFGCSAKHFREYMIRKTFAQDNSPSGFSKCFDEVRASVDQIIVLHTKLINIDGLHPDSEDELNVSMLSTAEKRAAWRHSSSMSRSRADSITSSISSISVKPPEVEIQNQLIRIVRGNLTSALKEILQHGLCVSFSNATLSTKALVGCMSSQSIEGLSLHIWEYFNKFYQLKQGDIFNTQPSMMLSEAFAMDVGCTQQTPKQSLLTVLHRIKTTHEPRKRSFDAMFKALISAALNRGRLAQWIRLVIRCPELVDNHYERWSYVIRTGFDEVLTTLEKLSSLTFFLPEDLAIRHLLKSSNEFGDA